MRNFCLMAALLILVATLALRSYPDTPAARTETMSATYSQGTLHTTIPYHAAHSGPGRLTVDVLNPEDTAVGHVDHMVGANDGNGWWQEDLKIVPALSTDDLVWHRLRYRFTYTDGKDAPMEETESISRILLTPAIRVIGQQSYLAGSPAAMRLIVSDSHDRPIAGTSTVRIELAPSGQSPRVLFDGRMNERGTTEAQFRFPAGITGSVPVRYIAQTPLGSAEFVQTVRLEDKSSILLTTEKPIYQPGQTIHVRALALDKLNHEATANRKLTFEIEDSRGNKVFKRATQTDTFGVASAEFGLADEVNLGTYHLRASLGDTNPAEMAFNVERYVLPKFKVALEMQGAGKHGYRPGDHVTGTVRANYFFGKPVDGGEITVKGTGMDVAMFEVGQVAGKTDSEGAYRFDLKLPDYFAGRPLSQGAARVLIEASVKDTAGHSESRGEPITVSQSPILITAVPEGGTLIPDVENQVFILTSYPDGKPAPAEVRIRANGVDQRSMTDAGGVAVVSLVPSSAMSFNVPFEIEAADREGNHASNTLSLAVRAGEDRILLRTERAVYRAGDRIPLKLYSTKKTGTVYVDVVRQGQTMLTRDLDLVNGRAELTLTATPELTGTVDFNAYIFDRNAQPVSDHRLAFVQPADELKIEATADAAVYRPGGNARIRFRVTNSRGEGVRAALGLQVIDEAVFALAEKQPGFAKVFFYLEQEVMKPRYEIHSVGMTDAVETGDPALAAQRDRAARALFAATELVNHNQFNRQFGKTVPMARYGEYLTRYRTSFTAQMRRAADELNRVARVKSDGSDLAVMVTRMAEQGKPEFRDPWGSVIDLSYQWKDGEKRYYGVRSRGPDKQLNTGDDLAVVLEVAKNGDVTVNDRIGIGFGGGVGAGMGGGVGGGVFRVQGQMGMQGQQGGVLGGIIGGVPGGTPLAQFARLEMAPRDLGITTGSIAKEKDSGGVSSAHVRSWFPEALYINPEIITDRNGEASIAIPIADNITTWRMAMMASTPSGALGTGTSSLKVFQDFFVDLDLPVTLTQGDRISIPVAAYNYSPSRGDVSLELQPDNWFRLVEDVPDKTIAVDSQRVGGSQFTLEATRIGKFKLTLSARMAGGAKRADIVVREIEVVPNGREQNVVFNGRLEPSADRQGTSNVEAPLHVAHAVNFPSGAIPDAGKIYVRLYPGPLSQVIEGMDSILRMPGGCFEQTSSSTYPNVLTLDYMKSTKKLTPEIHAKAEGYIANGYQRLLTFEVQGGGFSWFGQAPANKILTGYGLMEFSDMSKVFDVDPNVITRTQQWLAGKQQQDGSWEPDKSFINEGATNRYNSGLLRITAYLGWSLENTGYKGPAVEKAKQFVEKAMGAKTDPYTLAVLANFAADFGKDREFTRRAMTALLDSRTEQGDQVWWSADETGVYATGASASVETTGLAVQALLKWGEANAVASKALGYLASKKDASGTWGTTQATIMALRALLLSAAKGTSDIRGTVEITMNGQPAERLSLTADNNELFHQFVLKPDSAAANQVEIRFDGKGSLAYQVVGRYFMPWDTKPENEPLSIGVTYDRTQLAQDDIATATATVRNNLAKSANMVMVDLGIPPGFDLLSEDLDSYKQRSSGQKSGRLEKFSLTATQAILYFDSIGAGDTVTLRFRLRAKYPIRAKTFASRVYEYYDPDVNSVARPVQLEVRKK
ncbi:MAG TPA: MG2 domain-containing protein [Bryobacteraceae bacterium]|nr:MG2 domain-containing protein [Bryobacteraceae bacterium]